VISWSLGRRGYKGKAPSNCYTAAKAKRLGYTLHLQESSCWVFCTSLQSESVSPDTPYSGIFEVLWSPCWGQSGHHEQEHFTV